jgi:thioredoxin 1
MAATDLDDGTFQPALAAAPMAVVDFHAGWCGPCIMFKPKFKRISNDYAHVGFFLVDGEAAPASRKTVQITDLPYFAVYRNGVFVAGISTDKEDRFRAFVEEHFGKTA